MDKKLLDLMYKDGLISDAAYKEILNDIEIIEKLNDETKELKEELAEIKKTKSVFNIDQIIFNNIPVVDLNFQFY